MMRWKKVKELVMVDLLQTNRQSNQNDKRNKVTKANIWRRILLQNGLFLFIFTMFFGTVFFDVPLAEFPGLYTQSLAFMAVFVFFQMYQLIFNLFFDDTNLSEFLSLPFSTVEFFVSKIVTIVLNTVAFLILPFVLITMLGWQTGHSLLWVLPIALISTLLFIIVLLLVPFALIYILHQIPFYLRHKKVFTILIYLLLFIGLMFFVYSNDATQYSESGLLDTKTYPLFLGFYEIFIPESSLEGWLQVGSWALAAAGLGFAAFKWMIPDLYSEDQAPSASRIEPKRKERGTQKTQSMRQLLLRYQLRQLQDTSFIIQVIFAKFYFPLIIIAPMLFSAGRLDASFLSEVPALWGVFVLGGLAFSFLILGEQSVSGVIISFDKENFHYFKSLPLSFLSYMKFKFWFAFALEWLIGALLVVGFSFYSKLPFVFTLSLLVGFTIGTYIFSLYFFMRDYRLLNLDWNNFTELIQRGMNQFARIFLNFIIVIVGVFAIMGLSFWLLVTDQLALTITISIGLTLLVLAAAVGMYQYANKKFWIHFNQ